MKSCIGIGLLACVPAAAGQTESFWVGGGSFNDPISWNGPPPDETVTCIFELDELIEPFVQFHATGLSSRAVIRAGDFSFIMWDSGEGDEFSHHYDVVNASFNTPSFVVAESAAETATLTISHGFIGAQSMVVGMGAGSDGAVQFETGQFELTAGLSCVYELHVGGAGQGLLTVDQGVAVGAHETVLGVSAGSAGDVVITGSGSRLDSAGPLIVGKQGQGALAVDGQADVTSAEALIGMQPGAAGAVTLDGPGTSWTMHGSLDVGFQGEGSLSITGGAAAFTDGFAAIGTFPEPAFPPESGGVGAVTVSGPASLWLIEQELHVGLLWVGTLDVVGGATLTSRSGIVGFSEQPGSVANVEGTGSVWSTVDAITVYPDGMLRLADGGIVLASAVIVMEGGTLEADGSIVGSVDGAGTIRVGNSLGALHVQGPLTSTGDLQFEVGAPVPGGFDTAVIGGQATVGGALTVAVAEGYEPQVGDVFEVMTAWSIDGAFSAVNLPAPGPAGAWSYMQNADSIEVFLAEWGDLDGDGSVGITDFLQLLAAFGPCPAPPDMCPEDLDGDGEVGVTDLLILLGLWS